MGKSALRSFATISRIQTIFVPKDTSAGFVLINKTSVLINTVVLLVNKVILFVITETGLINKQIVFVNLGTGLINKRAVLINRGIVFISKVFGLINRGMVFINNGPVFISKAFVLPFTRPEFYRANGARDFSRRHCEGILSGLKTGFWGFLETKASVLAALDLCSARPPGAFFS